MPAGGRGRYAPGAPAAPHPLPSRAPCAYDDNVIDRPWLRIRADAFHVAHAFACAGRAAGGVRSPQSTRSRSVRPGCPCRARRCAVPRRCSRRRTGGTRTSARRRSIERPTATSRSSTTAARGGCIRTSAARPRRAARRSTAFPMRSSMVRSRSCRSPSTTATRATASTASGAGVPFYPLPAQAITQPHWIEGGAPGNVDQRAAVGPAPHRRRLRERASLRALQRLATIPAPAAGTRAPARSST